MPHSDREDAQIIVDDTPSHSSLGGSLGEGLGEGSLGIRLGLGNCNCLTRAGLLCQKERGLKKQREQEKLGLELDIDCHSRGGQDTMRGELGLGLDIDFRQTCPLGIKPGSVGFWLNALAR